MSELPNGWAKVALEELGTWGSGGTPKRTDSRFYSGGTIPWLVIGDLTDGVVTHARTYITEEGLLNSSAKLLPPNTLLIAMYGSIGKLGITGIECATNQAIAFCLPDREIIELRYLFHALKYSRDKLAIQGQGVAQKNISQTILKPHQIPVAPLNEQKRIADKLDSLFARVDACRDRLERIPRILKRFRQAVFADATSGQLTENLVNANWSAYWLGDLLSDLRYGTAKKSSYTVNGGIPVIRIPNILDGKVDVHDLKYGRFDDRESEALSLREGDVLLIRSNGSIDLVGRSAVVGSETQGYLFAGYLLRLRLKTLLIEPRYLYIFLSSPDVRRYIELTARSTSGVKNINSEEVRAIEVKLPPLDEQHEIIRRVEALLVYADRLEVCYRQACTKVEKLTTTLLDKAFRGELVPQDPNDEPASVLLERIKSEKRHIDSEQQRKRTVRRITNNKNNNKKKPTTSMRQSLDDYVKALRSAFQQLEGQTDARKLFDQAGFQAEEVVQFYEALRVTSEVRATFEKSTQEISRQTEDSIAKNGDDDSSEKGHFRLIELWLEDFKNLSDYTVRFDPSHSIDIILGWNGTGKSNLFESLVIIFRDLHAWSQGSSWNKTTIKGYRLRYEINQQVVDVSWNPETMRSPLIQMIYYHEKQENLIKIAKNNLPLPRFIFGYYSGPTNRLAEHFLPMNQAHYNRLLKATSDDPETLANLLQERRFFCAENRHAKYVLLAFFHKKDPAISQFLEERLRMVDFESALFVIRKPRWAKKGETAENFWGAGGIMRRVMERLQQFAIAPMVIEQTVSEGYKSKGEEHYYFFLPDLQSLHAFAAEYNNARTFFLALESIDFSELIYDLKIQVCVKATNTEQVAITFHELSEGEQQLLMVLGLMRFTKSYQSLVLLDEPDTHLNPHWSVDYLKLLTRVMSENSNESEEQQTSQILMSTHDPLVIASLFKEQIHLLKRDWQTGACKWEQPTVNPRGLGFTGILTSEMFGMRSDLDEETLADLDTKVRLIAKEGSFTPEEAIELEEINKRLEDAGFQKAFSDPYYAAFIRAWSRRYSDLMAGTRFLSPERREEVDRIAREVLEEVLAELEAEGIN
ncbi:restriction endonuclease subunit S [Planktothrix agardhii]|uniref:restriction endonuclease subunit S n=1 Tax=Planktothrix agardhii TaxID=1160 RepID=UPI001F3019E1|nr:restriction endonuclease subunit S [Planktothrix agardhii]MCF3644482.1 restriction endonuclease subunit S [Planktothrix agardhii 1026]